MLKSTYQNAPFVVVKDNDLFLYDQKGNLIEGVTCISIKSDVHNDNYFQIELIANIVGSIEEMQKMIDDRHKETI